MGKGTHYHTDLSHVTFRRTPTQARAAEFQVRWAGQPAHEFNRSLCIAKLQWPTYAIFSRRFRRRDFEGTIIDIPWAH
ncbi:hypothetical protein M3J09_005144 [Ascochyta lentis]